MSGLLSLSSTTFFPNLCVSADSIGPAAATQFGCSCGSSISTIGTPCGGSTASPISLTSSLALFTAPSLCAQRDAKSAARLNPKGGPISSGPNFFANFFECLEPDLSACVMQSAWIRGRNVASRAAARLLRCRSIAHRERPYVDSQRANSSVAPGSNAHTVDKTLPQGHGSGGRSP